MSVAGWQDVSSTKQAKPKKKKNKGEKPAPAAGKDRSSSAGSSDEEVETMNVGVGTIYSQFMNIKEKREKNRVSETERVKRAGEEKADREKREKEEEARRQLDLQLAKQNKLRKIHQDAMALAEAEAEAAAEAKKRKKAAAPTKKAIDQLLAGQEDAILATMKDAQTRYPTAWEAQTKAVASLLETLLAESQRWRGKGLVNVASFSDAAQHPLNKAPERVADLLSSLFHGMPMEGKAESFAWLFDTIDSVSGEHATGGNGLRMLLQALVASPGGSAAVLKNLVPVKAALARRRKSGDANERLSAVWALAQTLDESAAAAVMGWAEALLPYINDDELSGAAVSFIEIAFRREDTIARLREVRGGPYIISTNALKPLFDALYPDRGPMPNATLERAYSFLLETAVFYNQACTRYAIDALLDEAGGLATSGRTRLASKFVVMSFMLDPTFIGKVWMDRYFRSVPATLSVVKSMSTMHELANVPSGPLGDFIDRALAHNENIRAGRVSEKQGKMLSKFPDISALVEELNAEFANVRDKHAQASRRRERSSKGFCASLLPWAVAGIAVGVGAFFAV